MQSGEAKNIWCSIQFHGQGKWAQTVNTKGMDLFGVSELTWNDARNGLRGEMTN